jgi:hypothetical protein
MGGHVHDRQSSSVQRVGTSEARAKPSRAPGLN